MLLFQRDCFWEMAAWTGIIFLNHPGIQLRPCDWVLANGMPGLTYKHFIGDLPSLFPLLLSVCQCPRWPWKLLKMAEPLLVWFPNDCVEQRFQGISVTVVSVTLATQITLSCLRIPVACLVKSQRKQPGRILSYQWLRWKRRGCGSYCIGR